MKNNYGAGWELIKAALRLGEITAPSLGQIPADSLVVYAKDRSGTSSLYFKDDAGVEHDLGALTSAAALTKVDDTNVTLTLGGTPATALLQAVSLTLGWTGTLAITRGGTGKAALENVTAGSSKISLGGTPTGAVVNAFSIDVNQANLDHGSIGGLGDDDHSIYALLAGRAGGQTLIGGTASGNGLTLQSTSHATKGLITLGTLAAYDEVNNRLGIGVTAPFQPVHLRATEADVGVLIDYFGDGPNSAFHALRHNRGTPASPTATQSGDTLGNFLFQGRYGTTAGDADIQNGAHITGVALENWTGSANGGKLVFYVTPTGATSPIDMVTMQIASDVAQLLLDNHGASKQINLTFKDNGTDKWIIYKDTLHNFNIYDANSAQNVVQFNNSITGLASDTGAMSVQPTVSSSNDRAGGMRVTPIFTGSGDSPQGFFAAPTFTPSGSITTAYGFLGLSVGNPGNGVTITNLYGLYAQCFFTDVAGAVTIAASARFAGPSIAGALKPGTYYGVLIDSVGAAGITTAVGARIGMPAGATNNFYAEFTAADATDPTGGGGAAAGRLPIMVGGVARYLAYY